MKLFLFFIFCLTLFFAQSQDISLLKKKLDAENIERPENKTGGLFGLYKNHLSDQILNDCIYDHSCSEFSRGAIKEIGPVKGLFLTADRLMRCNRASYAETPRVRINDEGKVKDHWDVYKDLE